MPRSHGARVAAQSAREGGVGGLATIRMCQPPRTARSQQPAAETADATAARNSQCTHLVLGKGLRRRQGGRRHGERRCGRIRDFRCQSPPLRRRLHGRAVSLRAEAESRWPSEGGENGREEILGSIRLKRRSGCRAGQMSSLSVEGSVESRIEDGRRWDGSAGGGEAGEWEHWEALGSSTGSTGSTFAEGKAVLSWKRAIRL
ncbi:hypothetical protein B0H67DRAFT_154132 [Lasiosphaeris hirsuta]|uniref:Uncharacterized protein n=1 Tax=Lasiosphaeris hirsuta TaxID=260670 RepID=A0AA40DZM5_9PEZI|nr:hypothetical protein B0H67DRAFT_154132 [Lasiosphaeris hirsuta]